MKNFIKWFAGFFEDQVGSASSKRATLYICLFFLWRITENGLQGKNLADKDILYFVVGIILFCLGAITSEFFKGKFTTSTSETKTEVTTDKQNTVQ
jgi:hypothetical protein